MERQEREKGKENKQVDTIWIIMQIVALETKSAVTCTLAFSALPKLYFLFN